MAAESTESAMASAGGLFPILMGFAASPGSDPSAVPDRIVLVNPLTRRMVVLEGDSALISEMLAEAGEVGRGGGGGAPPASKGSIESVEVGEEDGSECPVCLDELKRKEVEEEEEGAVVKEMPCRHRFHGVCIEKWLRMHGSCPVCRYRMPEEEVVGPSKDGEDVPAAAAEEGRRGRGVQVTIVIQRRTTTTTPTEVVDDLD